MKDGDTLIVGTGQAGTIIWVAGDTVQVLLRSGEIWTGPTKQCRPPQNPEDLAAAPVEVPRSEQKLKKR